MTDKLAIKFAKNQKLLENEICTLREMNKNARNVPVLIGHGILEQEKIAYVIMKKYHQNLPCYFQEKKASVKFVFEMGIQLLNSLECLHASGSIYNDFKPSNIMVDLDKNNELEVTLIDFSLTTKYLDMKDFHINNGYRLQ